MFGYATHSSKTDTINWTLKINKITDKLVSMMEKCGGDVCKHQLSLKSHMMKKNQWIFVGGGCCGETSSGCFDSEADGKYIGFDAFCHVLASGKGVC